ncbi:tRNA (adenosine(37)-N6)-threonylcarbamoyltransferase complex ATPase subunit type 1 TsaE [Lichenicola cladoniae]|uniref:tRNA threonylcarbamoyladenosine biosynthesis protein TsaE n=1 Tax=Lichenicola cladoniae TaxID=1484109 RepID=A0A6M8HL45_9PROT|nr:tRNA (adenosine(37)-N6)-threonylcarbamoyltransferase complex ATPase subunit type 1 TsaE [Lichenicola cladoniae]NPD68518.1 tRNA (adenosine(37)-N6)-threonylcarbamoyltransferase complex ATPase subunit type 1 TsaE [Acetobacteraceae bacterium]QKE88995.1 tRNA (adenosine(37)-N6)-threonylcarbamoyltransferase complex ATPase subunit type 1 TsaE [Lichenicola cladoniae]
MDSGLTCDLPDLASTEALGRALARLLRPGDSILLDGPLGAGKTALARALLREACGHAEMEVPSPSYTLVQTYEGAGFPIAHFDLWRLDGPASVEELGWDEARAGVVLVEWPDRLGMLAPADALCLTLELLPDTGGHADCAADPPRRVLIEGWPDRLLAGLATPGPVRA